MKGITVSGSSRFSLSRRGLLTGSVAAAGAAVAAASIGAPAAAQAKTADGLVRRALRFRDDGTFKIVQFNDTQDTHTTDERTIALQEAVLDDVRPDFVVINGDVITGGMTSEL